MMSQAARGEVVIDSSCHIGGLRDFTDYLTIITDIFSSEISNANTRSSLTDLRHPYVKTEFAKSNTLLK